MSNKQCVERLYACIKGVDEKDVCSDYQSGSAWVRLKSSQLCASAYGSTDAVAYKRLYEHLVAFAGKMAPVPDCAKTDILLLS